MKITGDVKPWAWGAGILGIVLIISGFMSQNIPRSQSGKPCKASAWTWTPVLVGFLMTLLGFTFIMRMPKKQAGLTAASPDPSITPEASTGPGDIGRA